ncbi:NADP-dependent oxidoreductase [Geodermatophilus marinus]|uniref:NADP-dependent oxidoreductase n=1 Tax=Geodermatophilus sp. LHW52908 TaxID=2303986 RepID=UPI001314ECAC|nr:NADP-dependent oxidoreductase [Geodermatophilus sp. LHW52908]
MRLHGVRSRRVCVDEVLPPRAPRADQLLVRVAASSVNGTDLRLLRGAVPVTALRGPFPLGFDVAGEVVARGPAVTSYEAGDRVLGLLDHGGGGQADRVLVPQSRVALLPAAVDPAEAGALPLAGLTALQALHGAAALHARRSPRVLVVGAAGGIGSYAVQLAKLAGAHVTAVARREQAGWLRDLGADEVADRDDGPLPGGGERWDVVLDTPAVLRLAEVGPQLADGGALVSTVPLSADVLRAGAGRLRRRRVRFAAVRTRARPADLARLVRLVAAGRLRVPVTGRVPLAGAAAAYADGGAGRGKLVVVI